MHIGTHMTRMFITCANAFRFRSERGASLIEYGFLVALIALVCVGALMFLGSKPSTPLSTVGSSLNG